MQFFLLKVEVYQADFNTEREERSRMAADKQQLSEEVHRLRARNQQLLEDMESLERRVNQEGRRPTPERSSPGPVSNFSTLPSPGRGISGSSSAANRGVNLPERTVRGSSEPRQFTCPKCYKSFMELGPLEVHVNQCLDSP
ncbi:hypothetical protein J437_LFUL018230 [Ladona fulva]|uniref:Uncharacterized protein n=1 Tax=Ladona fulva TaxID=123851 RepID=A0A8K0KRN3_LADFU|nr:hypothetical protein J437_LFUL018230 [Ladona fulva]